VPWGKYSHQEILVAWRASGHCTPPEEGWGQSYPGEGWPSRAAGDHRKTLKVCR